MTRTYKKQQFQALACKFLATPDARKLTHLREEIIGEVVSCEFNESIHDVTQILISQWNNNLSCYIASVDRNETDSELKKSTEISLLGLQYLFDLSGLPE